MTCALTGDCRVWKWHHDFHLQVVILEDELLNWLQLIITVSLRDIGLPEELKTSVGFSKTKNSGRWGELIFPSVNHKPSLWCWLHHCAMPWKGVTPNATHCSTLYHQLEHLCRSQNQPDSKTTFELKHFNYLNYNFLHIFLLLNLLLTQIWNFISMWDD